MVMSFFRYPGGKNKLKDIIISKILILSKDCDTYVEPFFGGGSIGLNLLKDHHLTFSKIWINDKDIGIVCLWDTVIRFPQLLKDKIITLLQQLMHSRLLKENCWLVILLKKTK
jgi:DNA adenine methylase